MWVNPFYSSKNIHSRDSLKLSTNLHSFRARFYTPENLEEADHRYYRLSRCTGNVTVARFYLEPIRFAVNMNEHCDQHRHSAVFRDDEVKLHLRRAHASPMRFRVISKVDVINYGINKSQVLATRRMSSRTRVVPNPRARHPRV